MTLHIYSHAAHARLVQHCRTCRRRRRVVAYCRYDGPVLRCCGCAEDPSRPGVRFRSVSRQRAERVRRAAADWQSGTTWRKALEAVI